MEEAAKVPPVETKGKGKMVGILVALVLVLSAGAAGAVFAPRLLAKPPAEKAAPAEGEEAEADSEEKGHGEESEDDEEPHAEADHAPAPASSGDSGKQRAGSSASLTELAPLVIDARAADGSVRHIKVVLVVEHPKDFKVDEFKRFVPFAREAAIAYLRTREFEQLADPKNFDMLRKQLASEIVDAVGKKHARRVLITDYVVQ
jgi:flagellar basal body-associated protein FliL